MAKALTGGGALVAAALLSFAACVGGSDERGGASIATGWLDAAEVLEDAGPQETYDLAAGVLSSASPLPLPFPTMCGALWAARDRSPAWATALERAAYFHGSAKVVTALGVTVQSGSDSVFDLYRQQAQAFGFTSGGLVTDLGSIGVTNFRGFAFGLRDGTSDWNGWFVSIGLSTDLAWTSGWMDVGASCFVSVPDDDGDGVPDGLDLPPDGLFGCSVALQVASPDPQPWPFDVGASAGRWQSDPVATDELIDERARFGAHGELDGDGNLVASFAAGQPRWLAGLMMAQAILDEPGVPLLRDRAAGAAVALGIVRDLDEDIDALCPDGAELLPRAPTGTCADLLGHRARACLAGDPGALVSCSSEGRLMIDACAASNVCRPTGDSAVCARP